MLQRKIVGWAPAGEDYFVASCGCGPSQGYRLAVERIPDAGWDWCVWSAADPGVSWYGLAETVDEAFVLAERTLTQTAH